MSIEKARLDECRDHGWDDLEEDFWGLIKSAKAYSGLSIKEPLEEWCWEVDQRRDEWSREAARVKDAEEVELQNGTLLEDE